MCGSCTRWATALLIPARERALCKIVHVAYALWCKRLERGTVKLPTVDPDHTPGPYRVEMTADDLGLILRGIDPAEVRRRSRYRKPAPA
jgi:hypothetical protein